MNGRESLRASISDPENAAKGPMTGAKDLGIHGPMNM